MRAALKIRGTSIVLHDTKGQQLLSTNRPFGEPLPRATNTEMHDRVVATGQPQISDLIMGAVLTPADTGGGGAGFPRRPGRLRIGNGARPGGFVRRCWRSKVFRPIGRPGSSIARASSWRAIENWIAFSANRFRRRFWKRCAGPARAGFPVSRVKASPYIRSFRRSPITGWTVAIGLPREFVDAPYSPRAIVGLRRRRSSPRLEPCAGLVDGSGDSAAGASARRPPRRLSAGVSRLTIGRRRA